MLLVYFFELKLRENVFLVYFYVLQRYISKKKNLSVFGADANKLSSSYFSCTKTVHYAAGICHDIIFLYE